MNKTKVVIFGTGKVSIKYLEYDFNYEQMEIVGIVDNNATKWGTEFFGFIVSSPESLKNIDYQAIIIASTFFDEIKNQLVIMGILSNRIQTVYYGMDEILRSRKKLYYEKNKQYVKEIQGKRIAKDEQVVVYTAITNAYDDLKEPLFVDPRCKYICFTDNPDLKSEHWEIRMLESCETDYNRQAKKVKILPHLFFPEFEWSIYIDGKFQITGDLVSLINDNAKNSNFLCFMHFSRHTVGEEAAACIRLGLDREELIRDQLKAYKAEGYPDEGELIEGGILFRKHNDVELIRVMECWWEEILNKSKRDQLSFNYVAWKNQFFFDILDLVLYDNKYVKYYPHNK